MLPYKVLFFDLDHTLWDFEANSAASLLHLFGAYELSRFAPRYDKFLKVYQRENHRLWELYRDGKVDKATVSVQRFARTLKHFGAPTDDAEAMSKQYLDVLAEQTAVFPNTVETLRALQPHYRMAIITNGFNEVQFRKIEGSGLKPFFDEVITSEEAGVLKPRPEIFELAMQKMNTTAAESLMIGDDLSSDIRGAARAHIDQVYFSPSGNEGSSATYMIRSLEQLITVVGLEGSVA